VVLTESASISSTFTRTDSIKIKVTNEPDIGGELRKSAGDSILVKITESTSRAFEVIAGDSIKIKITEAISFPLTAYIVGADDILVSVLEGTIIDNPTTASDFPVRRLHGKVKIVYSDPTMNEDSSVSASSGHGYGTSEAAIFDGRVGAAYKYMSLDGSSPLDGTIAIGDEDIGFWSDAVSDEDGVLSPDEYITIEFPTARVVHNFSISGDDQWDNYPVDFEITCYDEADQVIQIDGQDSLQVTGNSLWSWTYEPTTAVQAVKKIKYAVSKISRALAPLMITELYSSYYEDYTDSDLISITVYEEMDFTEGSIPLGNISANEVSVKIANADRRFSLGNPVSPVASLMLKNRRIEVWFGIEVPFGGATIWKKRGVFWTQDWSVPEDALYVEILGYDRLELLRTSPFYNTQIYTGYSIGELMEVVLDDAGLVQDTDYWIHADLYDITIPSGYFGQTTHKGALKTLAVAGLAKVYCDGDGCICAEPWEPGTAVRVQFTRDKILRKDNPLAFDELINSVQVYVNPRVVQAETEIFSDDEALTVPAGDEATMWCIFNTDDPCEDIQTATFTQSGADITLSDQTNYTWASLLTFSNAGETDQDVTGVTIDGKPVSVVGRKLITVEDEDSIRAYGKISLTQPLDNPFIQDATLARSIAESLLASYKTPRRDVEMDTWGYIDLEMGDRIEVVTYQNTELKQFALTSQELTYIRGVFRGRYRARRI
jgi:hypothetical protein